MKPIVEADDSTTIKDLDYRSKYIREEFDDLKRRFRELRDDHLALKEKVNSNLSFQDVQKMRDDIDEMKERRESDFSYLDRQIDRLGDYVLDLKNEIELLRTGLNKDERQELSDGINKMLEEKK